MNRSTTGERSTSSASATESPACSARTGSVICQSANFSTSANQQVTAR